MLSKNLVRLCHIHFRSSHALIYTIANRFRHSMGILSGAGSFPAVLRVIASISMVSPKG